MKHLLKQFVLLLLTLGFISLLSTGCQTANGFGKDVEKLGEEIQGK